MSATENVPIANDAAGAHSLHRIVVWLAWKADGRGYVFRAPQDWSMAQACKHAEEIYDDLFVTVQQL